MAAPTRTALARLRPLLDPARGEPDGDLLSRFASAGDEGAFQELLRRHGPMVLGLARRVVGDAHAAEDVFQAAFLALARKAASVRRPESLAAWLHGTAYRLAVRARRSALTRRRLESAAPARTAPDPLEELSARELLQLLDEELRALPENYRLPLILCCLEGLSHEEAARRLGWSPGSLKGRLERGRERLRLGLQRRGLTLPSALAGSLLLGGTAAAVTPGLARATLSAAVTGSGASPSALKLIAAEGIGVAGPGRLKVALAAVVLVGAVGLGAAWNAPAQSTPAPAVAPPPAPAAQGPERRAPGKGVDLHGDRLPDGAALRLGTVRRRAVGAKLAFRPDGKLIVGVRAGRYVHVWDAVSGDLRETRELPTDRWALAELSPDGRWLVTEERQRRELAVWDLQTGKRVRGLALPVARHISPVTFSADGKLLAAVANTGEKMLVRAWDLTTGKEVLARDLPSRVSSDQLAFSPDGKRLLASFTSADEGMFCWDLASGRLAWQNKKFHPSSMAFTSDGKILSTSPDLPVVDLATGQPAAGVTLPQVAWDNRLTLTPDGRTLLLSTERGVVVWDLRAGKEVRTLAGAGEELVVAPDGKTVVTNNGALQRWDLATGKALYPDTFAEGHIDEVIQVAFSADGRRLVSSSRDGTVRVWDAGTGRLVHLWRAHAARRPLRLWNAMKAGATALDVTPDGRWVASAGPDGRLRLWDAASGKEARSIPLPDPARGEADQHVLHVRLSPDGSEVVALFGAHGFVFSTNDPPREAPTHQLAAWEVKTGKLLRRHAVPIADTISSALAPGGTALVSHGKVIDARTGKERCRLEGALEGREPYAFSADGRLVAGGFARQTKKGGTTSVGPDGVRVWEAATGKAVAHLKTKSWVGQLAFHPDGRHVLTNDLDGLQVWDLVTGKVVFTRKLHEQVPSSTTAGSYAACLAFTADGRRLATGHPDSTVLVWDVPLPPRAPAPPGPEELGRLWEDLSGAETARAWRAVWRSAGAPEQAVAELRGRLRAVASAPADVTGPLVADLSSASFPRREAAARRLRELGDRAEAALRAALPGGAGEEMRRRVEVLLDALDAVPRPLTPEVVRDLRAVAVLELAGTPEARRILEALTVGIPSAPLTREARAALGRLVRKAATP